MRAKKKQDLSSVQLFQVPFLQLLSYGLKCFFLGKVHKLLEILLVYLICLFSHNLLVTSYLIVGYLQIFPFNGDSKTSPNLVGFTSENKKDAAI